MDIGLGNTGPRSFRPTNVKRGVAVTQRRLYMMVALRAAFGFAGLCVAMRWGLSDPVAGSVMGVLVIWYSAPYVMWKYRKKYEGTQAPKMFDLRKGSWAYLIGDTIVLPIGWVALVFGWNDQGSVEWGLSSSLLLCLLAGIAAGSLFHASDTKGYKEQKAEDALKCPTKIAHDFCAYPVLLGGLLYGFIPFFQNWSWYSSVFIGSVFVWLILAGCDMKRGLLVPDLHVRWNPKIFRPMKWPRRR